MGDLRAMILELSGVIPPLPTPFDEGGEVDFAAFEENVELLGETPVSGYVVLGSNGEACYLSDEEKLRLVEIAVKRAPRGKVVIAGTGLESTKLTLELSMRAAERGAHAVLCLTPSYYKNAMSDDALIRHFEFLADNLPLPVLIYNMPKNTGLNVSARVVEVLSKHPNICGMKDSAGDAVQLANFLSVSDASFNLMVGTASTWFPGLCLGLKAGIMALANCAPFECARVKELFDSGRVEEARALYLRLLPLNALVTGVYGVPALKFACELVGLRGGRVRRPLLELDEAVKAKIRAVASASLGRDL